MSKTFYLKTERIIAEMEYQGFTVKSLAKQMKISPKALKRYIFCQNKKRISFCLLLKLAITLDTPLYKIVSD